ncbi:DUF4444 domain-containing protein [Halocynthiibacter sp. C4]|uniref:biotin/lipoate--protein ligase family protein n=1 Tax=Halocynthiibacter sp. C4 TaxID=2992758 RepID=UPI00237BCC1C|nr:biotin/lipoate--protein ligase family protein [Halocynthiibacter sp. C4]MDE0588873.1 DUF4444 domain-containing protein [Halocynthiibacter sp. C4]
MVQFPPLMSGIEVPPMGDAFKAAQAHAARGCDAGLIAYSMTPDELSAAIVFAPEVPLAKAMVMLPTCGIGFQNALGVLAPPEVALHLAWDGGFILNGAKCGGLRAAASTSDPAQTPDWLVIGLSVPIWPSSGEGEETPETTALFNEGCAEIDIEQLLESWAKHTLVWVNRWEEEGTQAIHSAWSGLAWKMGDQIDMNGERGIFQGVVEDFGMLFKTSDTIKLFPLTAVLES